jgi:16S rRNA (cytosine1407-C5)-methyltransferase
VPWSPAAFILRNKRLADLQETPAYREGRLYVQSLSSMLPPLILDPQPGEEVLDLTAAPGSKTTQIACLMRGQGRLVANDNNRIRSYKLRANVQQQGASMVELTRRHGESFGRRPAFDRVLVDAPCGTEGRFFTGRASSYNYWRPVKIHEMVVKQRRLLRAGAAALRPGGRLVYSTCTFAPEENEGVLDWLLKTSGMPLELEPVRAPVAHAAPGLAGWGHEAFDPQVSRAVRVLPTSDMEGFFIAALRKADGR